jgi:hypothetical protein
VLWQWYVVVRSSSGSSAAVSSVLQFYSVILWLSVEGISGGCSAVSAVCVDFVCSESVDSAL